MLNPLLDIGIADHEQNSPGEGRRGRLGACQEEVENRGPQVLKSADAVKGAVQGAVVDLGQVGVDEVVRRIWKSKN